MLALFLFFSSCLRACLRVCGGGGYRCVVRNPWDRLVSDWRWRRKSNLPLSHLSFPNFARFVVALVAPPPTTGSPTVVAAGGGWDAAVPPQQFAAQYLGHFKAQVWLSA